MIETNEPMTETREQTKPPESDLVQTARDAGAAAQERLGDLRDAALSSLDEAKSTATEKAGEAKAQAADEIARTARGLEAAAEEMEGSPLQQDLLREAADGLKQIAHAVEGKSIGTMAAELSEFGRQNPVAYLGGAALVGFALARFARASTPAETDCLLEPLRCRASEPIRRLSGRRPTSPEGQIMADPQERSTPGLMADLLDQVTQLVRKEVQLFRAEMSDKATQAMVAAGSILAAAVVAITALNVLAAALVAALANAGIPGAWSAVIVGVGLAIVAFRAGEEGHRQPQGRQPGTGADNPRRGSGRLDGEGENLMAEFSTNPGDRSVTELEREVDRERERVSATIDELQARASVGSLVDQLVKAVGENGGEVSRNLGRSLRDNPLAALLTGVGLAWLMAGSGRPRDEGHDWEDPDRDYLRYGRDRLPRRRARRVILRKRH